MGAGALNAPRAGGNGPDHTPGSVPRSKSGRRSSLSGHCCQYPLAAYPRTRRDASASSVWPCSERGLPSRPCHHGRWWALTPPFQPYRARRTVRGGLLSVALSRGLPRVGVTHRSSLRSPDVPRRGHSRAATRPSHRPIPDPILHRARAGAAPARTGAPEFAVPACTAGLHRGRSAQSSSTRTRIAPVPGQKSSSSGAAALKSLSSAGVRAMLLASETAPRRRAAPMPMRPRSSS